MKSFFLRMGLVEKANTVEIDECFVILPNQLLPHLTEKYRRYTEKLPFDSDEYNSENTRVLTTPEIDSMLVEDGWFQEKLNKENPDSLNSFDLKNPFKVEGWQK
jgi:hypothetical protein